MKTKNIIFASVIALFAGVSHSANYTYDNATGDDKFNTLGNWQTGGSHNLTAFETNNNFILNNSLALGDGTTKTDVVLGVAGASWTGGGLTLGADTTLTLKNNSSIISGTFAMSATSRLVIEAGASFAASANSVGLQGTVDVYGKISGNGSLNPRFDGNNLTMNFHNGADVRMIGNNIFAGNGDVALNFMTGNNVEYRISTFGSLTQSGNKIITVGKGTNWNSITVTLQAQNGNTYVDLYGSASISTLASGNFVIKDVTGSGDIAVRLFDKDASLSFGIDYDSATLNYGTKYSHTAKTLADFGGDKSLFEAYQKDFVDIVVQGFLDDSNIRSELEGYDVNLDYIKVITTNATTGISKFQYTATLIPEPAEVVALLGLIALGFIAYRRRK